MTVNIFSLAAQREAGRRSRLLDVRSDGKDRWDSALEKVGTPGLEYSRLDHFQRLCFLQQLTLAYGEQFWPQVHRALREVGDPPPVNERLDPLAFHASRSVGENLVEPFQKWGVSLSDAGIRRINALSLPGATYDPRKLREPSA